MAFVFSGLEKEEVKKRRAIRREGQAVKTVEATPSQAKTGTVKATAQPTPAREEILEERKTHVIYQPPSGYVQQEKKDVKYLYVWMQPQLDILKVRLEEDGAVIYATNNTNNKYGFYVDMSTAPYELIDIFVNPGETKDLVKLRNPGNIRFYYTKTSGDCKYLPLSMFCWSTPYEIETFKSLPECFVECYFVDIKVWWV
ncbi:MAG: hypothetical protein QXT64_03000 [Desulfurococcaceae archaeon]